MMISRKYQAKLSLAALAFVSIAAASTAQADVLYTSNFGSLTNGNLVGQGGWSQTGTSTATPIQVNNGAVTIGTSGQDANVGLSQTVVAGQSAYAALTATITGAQAAGDYFFHFDVSPADSTLFTGRLFVKSSGTGGYVLGLAFGSTGVTYGTTVLSLNTPTTIVEEYDIVNGTTNDTAAIYVNPTDTVQADNTPYMTFTNSSVSEPTQVFGSANLRQGNAANAPTVSLTSLTVATSFSESLGGPATPEPASLGVLALGGLALLARRRK